MRNLLIWFFGTESSFGRKAGLNRPLTPIRPTPTAAPALPDDSLQPLKNWCHPFKDTRNPLEQLTHLAKASAGYYPLGRNGLWHGGVHFDSGTAGTLKQSSVHCLADGEVVAYRIDTHSPKTTYFASKQTVENPCSRNFVLVRHRLQPPKIEGSPDTPPSLIFCSLYMHLQDWAVYQESTLTRPAFWPERPTHRVKQTANDFLPEKPEQRGLNVRHRWHGQVIDLLPRGAEVTISGTGQFRKLENTLGPVELLNPDGSIKGYIAARVLRDQDRKETRIQSSQSRVNVRAEPVIVSDNVLFKLPVESEVTVSGKGEFRKLEGINQYVHFDSLENAIEPVASDQVVVLDTPVPIKAGDLIGHLGQYQDNGADQPEEKLHLETFSGDDVELFIEASRAWAQRLPEKDKTWLKLAKGTPVVAPEGNLTATQLQIARASSPLSAADLLVPKTLLDKLPADHKLQMPASPTRKACTWYRLEGLLHDANNAQLDGWVREEIGVTPWVSPWSWEGYDIIYEYDVPQEFMASFLRAIKQLSEVQLERFGPMADEGDTGPLKTRLYDIIDRNRDGRMTAEELRAAISLPAHAQAISQLIVCCDSEWYYKEGKWDRLDELHGHSGSTPNLNWFAEKRRIKQLSWWGEVAEQVGLPGHGEVYHFHPVGLAGSFWVRRELITIDMLKAADTQGSSSYHQEILPYLNMYAPLYKINTPLRIAHFLAQVGHESRFRVTSENGNFSPKRMREIFGCKGGQKNYNKKEDDCDLGRLRNRLWTHEALYANNAINLLSYVYANRMGNEGEETQDGYKYRGRGIIQLTGRFNYEQYTRVHNAANPSDVKDFVENPDLIINSLRYGVESAFVYCSMTSFNLAADEDDVEKTTKIINGGQNGLHERKEILNRIKSLMGGVRS